ncbi:MAG: hypothetical protein BWY87_01074 [Deltaproteobacteria bacterium ADurb.Bin510]|nr:MAG: hypothetical protein BWY87_01074 [Deltaproteobacteria bacterium ADurb.Bin510]
MQLGVEEGAGDDALFAALQVVHGVGGVFQEVADGAAQLRAVEVEPGQVVGRLDHEVDLGVGLTIEHHAVADHLVQIVGHQVRAGHLGKGREFVDQVLHLVDLADDHAGALVEDLGVLKLVQVAPAQALGRQLDRRQRVLDLVGDAARHLAPGRHALHLLQLGQVVEDHHQAQVFAAVVLEHRGVHHERHFLAAQRDDHLALGRAVLGFEQGFEQLVDHRQVFVLEHLHVGLTEHLFDLDGQHLLGRRVDHRDAVVTVDRDDAGRDVVEHGLDVAVAVGQLVVGRLQALARVAQVADHGVEGLAELAEFVAGADLDFEAQVALRDALGAGQQALDRRGQALGDLERKPDRDEDHQQHGRGQ